MSSQDWIASSVVWGAGWGELDPFHSALRAVGAAAGWAGRESRLGGVSVKGRREGARDGRREEGRRREGGREGRREGVRGGGREGGRAGGWVGGRAGGKEGGREDGKVGGSSEYEIRSV